MLVVLVQVSVSNAGNLPDSFQSQKKKKVPQQQINTFHWEMVH